MKKEFISPSVQMIPIFGTSSPICTSFDNLTELEEKDDLEGLDWDY